MPSSNVEGATIDSPLAGPILRVRVTQARRWVGKGALALADQGLFATSGFFTTVVLARWLPPAQYGAYALAFTVFLFAASLHNALLLEPMAVLGSASYRKCLPEYLGKLVRVHFAIGFLLALVMVLGAGIVSHSVDREGLSSALWGASLGTPWVLFYWFVRRATYLDSRPDLAVRGAAIYAMAVLLMLSALRSMGWLSPFYAFLTQAVAGLVAGIFLTMWNQAKLISPPGAIRMATVLTEHWAYGRWVVPTAFVYWFSGQAYYVIVATLLSTGDVATLRAVQNIALPLPQFVTATSLLLLPWVARRFAGHDVPSVRRAVNQVSVLFVTAASVYFAGAAICGKWLILVLYNGQYVPPPFLLPALALSSALLAASQGPVIGLMAMQAPQAIFFGYGVAGIATILAGVALTHYWALTGTGLALVLSSLCFLITVTYCYRSVLETK